MGECDQKISATMRANSQNFLFNLEKTNFNIKHATKAFIQENNCSILCLETSDFDVTRVLVAETLINFKKDKTLKENLSEIVFVNLSSLKTMSPEENEEFCKNFPDLFICILDVEEPTEKHFSILAKWINIIKENNKKIIFIVKSAQNLQKVMMEFEMANISEIRLSKLWPENGTNSNKEAICANRTNLVTDESVSERALDEDSSIIIKEDESNGKANLYDEVKDEKADLLNLLQSLGVEELDAVDQKGNTQLHLAAQNGKKEIVESLLLHGAKKDVKNNGGETALHLAAEKSQRAIVQMLLEHGFDVNATSNYWNQWTPLHFACCYQNDALLVEILLKFGAEMERKDSSGQTALHRASLYGHSAVVNSLLKNGAKINVQDNDGDTPLHDATSNNKPEMVSILLQHGALFNIKNKQQQNALDVAKRHKFTEIIQIFENHK